MEEEEQIANLLMRMGSESVWIFKQFPVCHCISSSLKYTPKLIIDMGDQLI